MADLQNTSIDTTQDDPDDDEEDQLAPTPKVAAQPVSPLAAAVKAGADKIQKSASSGAPTSPMPEQDSQYYLNELHKLANDPKYQTSMPEESRASLHEALANAKQLYKDQADRNDWYQVAQTLGRAVAQFGAAQAGKQSGLNMSNINMGPEVDYESRNRRALGEYQQDVSNAKLEDLEGRQNLLDTQKINQVQYQREAQPLLLGAKQAIDKNKQDAIMSSNAANNKTKIDVANIHETGKTGRVNTQYGNSDDDSDTGPAPTKSPKQSPADKQAAKQAETERTVAPQLESSLSSWATAEDKKKPAIEKEIRTQAGKLGISGAAVMQDFSKSTQEPGMLWGTNPVSDPTKLNAAAHQTILNYLQKNHGVTPNTPGAAPAAPQQSVTGGRVKVKAPNGTVGTLPQEQVDQAVSQGYTVVQ